MIKVGQGSRGPCPRLDRPEVLRTDKRKEADMGDMLELSVMDTGGWHGDVEGGKGVKLIVGKEEESTVVDLQLVTADSVVHCLLDHWMATRLMTKLGACLEEDM